MRNLFLVTYDVCDARRLRKVYKKMHGFGKPAQYSVFLCPLSRAEKFRLLDQIGDLIKHDEDRVMIVDLGPDYEYAVVGHPSRDYLWILSREPTLDPEVYFIAELPVEISLSQIAWILGMTLAICFVATIPPSLRAAKLRPVEGLRYE